MAAQLSLCSSGANWFLYESFCCLRIHESLVFVHLGNENASCDRRSDGSTVSVVLLCSEANLDEIGTAADGVPQSIARLVVDSRSY
jgi:hypothetical protein